MKKRQATIEEVLNIEPEKLYFTDYLINSDGNKIDKTGILKGGDLTAYQIPSAEKLKNDI